MEGNITSHRSCMTALGGVATTYGLWSSYESTITSQQQQSQERTENFTTFRTTTQDREGYLQDQVNWLMNQDEELRKEILEGCHK